MSDRRTFGQAVREARLAKGLSMGQLAAAVERSTASVRRWERDQGVPTETVVQGLIEVLDLDEAETVALAAAALPVVPAPPHAGESSDPTRATSAPATGTTPQAIPSSSGSGGWLASLRDSEKPWLGYLRAVLTIVGFALLAWVLIWALEGFLESFGDAWESLWIDAS